MNPRWDGYLDLVGLPFRDGASGPDAFDCWGLAREVRIRAGLPCVDVPEAVTSEAEALALQQRLPDSWRALQVGETYELFDWIVSTPPDGIRHHVSTVVDTRAWLALTVDRTRGVFVQRVAFIKKPILAFRGPQW